MSSTILASWNTQSSVIRSALLEAIPGVVHGFGTRLGVEAPKSAGLQSTAALRQVHSDTIHVVNEQTASQLTGDGLITAVAGLALKIRTADCVPLLIAASDGRAVGAFHAGWRGTLARIAEKAVGAFRQRLDIAPEELVAAIGPRIHSCCYEVSAEMRDHFSSQFDYGTALFTEVFSSDPVREKYPLMFMNMRAPGHGEQPSKPHLDLVEANRRQLVSAGVPEGAIDISPLCTSCRTDLLFSYRAEKGTTGRLVTQIARTAPGAARLA